MWDSPTPFDLRWQMFGTRITVTPWFWLTLALLGWNQFEREGPIPLLIWILAGFISILLHEFGHVLMGRVFGNQGSIVMTAFCGLAIGTTSGLGPWRRIAVSAAGPAIQLAFYGLLKAAEVFFPGFLLSLPPNFILLFVFLLFINFYWALLNLLPIYPLDGGQILCDFLEYFMRDKGRYYGHGISFALATALAIFFFTQGNGGFFAIFLALNAVQNFQLMQAHRSQYHPPDDYPWTR